MAKVKYPIKRSVNLSKPMDRKLVGEATKLGIKPAELARQYIEQGLTNGNK